MILPVTKISSLAHLVLQASEKCRIHSFYSNTINLIFAEKTLVTIMNNESGIHPFSLHVENMRVLNVANLSEEPCIRNKQIIFDNGTCLPFRDSIRVDLNQAACLSESRQKKAGHLLACAPMICNQSALGFLLNPYQETTLKSANDKISGFLSALCNKDDQETIRLSSHLIGLGLGLTPSFDDFLVGLTASLYFLNSKDLQSYLDIARKVIAANYERTNLISYNFLQHAVGGYFSQAIYAVLNNCYDPVDESELRRCVVQLLNVGHSSGADTLVGLISGISLFEKLAPPFPGLMPL